MYVVLNLLQVYSLIIVLEIVLLPKADLIYVCCENLLY